MGEGRGDVVDDGCRGNRSFVKMVFILSRISSRGPGGADAAVPLPAPPLPADGRETLA